MDADVMIEATGLSKTFVLHTQGQARIPVFADLGFSARAGECVALAGRSGAGKSTLLRALYANYRPQAGAIRVRHRDAVVDLATAPPRAVLDVRRYTLGYVSQFLRVVPRVSTLSIVTAAARRAGLTPEQAQERAAPLLHRLNLPTRLWDLAPGTFSGGEQQRVNIARTFVVDYPILLLDEPTASLDARNREAVIGLIHDAKARGAAIVGIFHDHEVRDAVCDRLFEMNPRVEAA